MSRETETETPAGTNASTGTETPTGTQWAYFLPTLQCRGKGNDPFKWVSGFSSLTEKERQVLDTAVGVTFVVRSHTAGHAESTDYKKMILTKSGRWTHRNWPTGNGLTLHEGWNVIPETKTQGEVTP
jgi:hypothetical protein